MVDLKKENIQYLVTLVDSLDVDAEGNLVGVIATKTANAIKVKFNDMVDETALLRQIRAAAKNAGFKPSKDTYEHSIARAHELFTEKNGDRKAFRNVLLIVTDETDKFIHSKAADKISEWKKVILAQGKMGRVKRG